MYSRHQESKVVRSTLDGRVLAGRTSNSELTETGFSYTAHPISEVHLVPRDSRFLIRTPLGDIHSL